MGKRLYAMILAVCTAVCLFASPVSVLAANSTEDEIAVVDTTVTASGTMSTGLTWELTDDGVLSINGSSSMSWFTSASVVPWYEYRTDITTVVIGSGVTSIGRYAFYECSNMTSISIPDTVSSIGVYAFYCCSSLTEVTIPDGVTTIDTATFYGCTSLLSVTIPDSVTTIGAYAFVHCLLYLFRMA